MKFDEVIRYKALALKNTMSGPTAIFDLLKESDTKDMPNTRNICAIIHVSLFEKVESLTNLLNISKRQFVENALIEAVERANIIVKEVNPMEFVGNDEEQE